MSGVALRVISLGKRYDLPAPAVRTRTLAETMTSAATRLLSAPSRSFRRRRDEGFWALRDVSFTVDAGEIVGVIGSNGAGKSTLLKILSRVTAPTTGRAEVHGRLGSLLEIGTGFHPELSGRENVFLNGAILGMRQAEIRRKFDEIVAFAEVEPFIDVPVKRYSSGMYLRLAFAVAAHLEPEILLLDEVLAVGDAAFQKKCFGKMDDIAHGGRTVLFVSHNMPAIESLCQRVMWIRRGSVERIGEASTVVAQYLKTAITDTSARVWADPASAPGNDWIRLQAGRVRPSGDPTAAISVRTPFAIEIEYWNLRAGAGLSLSVNVFNAQGVHVFSAGLPQEEVFGGRPMPAGLFRDRCCVPGDLLNDGVHRVELCVMRGPEIVFRDREFLSFTVEDSTYRRGAWFGKWPGAVRPDLPWVTECVQPLSTESDVPIRT